MFSTVTGVFHASLSFCANRRAVMSVALPAVKPTMIRTGLDGRSCARAIRDTAESAAAPAARCRKFRRGSFITSLSEMPVTRRSFRLDAGELDHLAPLLGLIGNELSELDRAHRHGHMAYLSHPRLDLGFDEAGVDLTIERLDDLGRRTTRGDNTNP